MGLRVGDIMVSQDQGQAETAVVRP